MGLTVDLGFPWLGPMVVAIIRTADLRDVGECHLNFHIVLRRFRHKGRGLTIAESPKPAGAGTLLDDRPSPDSYVARCLGLRYDSARKPAGDARSSYPEGRIAEETE